jgi:hypothetical protein
LKKIISLLIIFFFLSFSATSVFAKTPVSQPKEKILNSNEIVQKDYFATGNYVAVHGTVDGDVYLVGGSILVDGTINGDIIALGGQIVIEAKKVNNIRAMGGSIIINSKEVSGNATLGGGQVDIAGATTIKGSLVAGAGELRIGGPIGKGAHVAGGQVSILSSVNGDVFAAGNKIILSPDAKISGNFTYWSKNKIELAEKTQINGVVTQKTPPNVERVKNGSMVAFSSIKIVGAFIGFVTAIIFGILFIYLLPNYSTNVVKTINSKFWKNLGVGFLTTILTPILFIVLLITVIGMPFSFLLIFSYLILAYFAKIFISMAIGQKVFKYLKAKNSSTVWAFIVGLFVYCLISLIPLIGGVFSFLAMLFGIGALLITKKDYFILLREKKII